MNRITSVILIFVSRMLMAGDLRPGTEIQLGDGLLLQHKLVGFVQSDGQTHFDDQEIYVVDSAASTPSPKPVFKSLRLENSSLSIAELESLLDAKLFGQEIEAVLRVRTRLSSSMAILRFKKPSGVWEFAGYAEIPDTNTFNASISAATLSEKGHIRATWNDGTSADFLVSPEGVILKNGAPYRPKNTKYDESSGLAAGQQLSYHLNYLTIRKHLEQLGVVPIEGYPNGLPNCLNYRLRLEREGIIPVLLPKMTANTAPATVSPDSQAPPVKAPDTVKLVSSQTPASGLSWAWWLVSLVVIGLLVVLLKRGSST